MAPGSINDFTNSPVPSDNVMHLWTIVGGTINGSATGATVNVTVNSSGGVFTLTDNISRFGCTSSCNFGQTVCSILPVTASVPNGTTTIYTAPAGMVTNAWTITGNGTISGLANTPSVTVVAGDACGSYTLSLESTLSGVTSNCSQTVAVTDNIPPTFTLPVTALSYCANRIISANYNAIPTDPDYDDLTTPRPEYYKFVQSSTEFNLTALAGNFADNCCATNTLVLHWRVDFSPTPNPADPAHALVTKASITDQTGQPSAYASDIEFPSDGVTFTDVTHKLFYWLVDCNGKASAEQTLNITVKPRPNVQKIN
jgi:hypothetical protein